MLLQSLNNSLGIVVMADSIFAVLNFVHCENTLAPIVVALAGITIDDKLMQEMNAYCLMVVTLDGMVTLSKLLQCSKAYSPIVTRPDDAIDNPDKLLHVENA